MLNIHDIIGHEIALVGFRYHCDDDWQEEYTEGYQFSLERDYGNDYDDHAVAEKPSVTREELMTIEDIDIQ